MSFSLNAVWQRVLTGEERAWRELVSHFEPLVYSLASRAGLSSAEAADCFQHTWLSLYQHRKNIKESQRLPGWIVTTVKREAFRRLKLRSRQTSLDDLPETVETAPNPHEELELTERQFYLEVGLSQLDERCRLLLRALFYEEDEHSYSGLASDLRLSINAIGPLRKRCLMRLRELLIKEGFTAMPPDSSETHKTRNARKRPPATLKSATNKRKSIRKTGK